MFELVNPSHPDKVADRIAGAIVDLSYKKQENPKVACEVLIGHGICHIINETSCHHTKKEIKEIVERIGGKLKIDYVEVPQDIHLATNQEKTIRCGDNGIFKGLPKTEEMVKLNKIARRIYGTYGTDGKYIIDGNELIICQSIAATSILKRVYKNAIINPLGYWTGGTNVDTGATNRKLGSDMGEAVTGGGLHGKDLSKADVSINIYAHLLAQQRKEPIYIKCAIGDEKVKINNNEIVNYSDIVEVARHFIKIKGGFEHFAEWGLN